MSDGVRRGAERPARAVQHKRVVTTFGQSSVFEECSRRWLKFGYLLALSCTDRRMDQHTGTAQRVCV